MSLEKDFESEVLNKIKEEKITPKARWTFLLRDYVIWALGLLSLVVGSMAVSVIIYMLKHNEWTLYTEIRESGLQFLFLSLPYFWLLVLALFIFSLNYNLKHTKKGYRYPIHLVFVISVGMSVIFGAVFYELGIGRAIDDTIAKSDGFYMKISNPMMGMWNMPEQGRLAGLIIEEIGENRHVLIDISKNEWQLDTSNTQQDQALKIGVPIKLLGEKKGEYYFVVHRAIYHNGPGQELMRRRIHEQIKNSPFIQERMNMMDLQHKECWRDVIESPELKPGLCDLHEEMHMQK